MIWIWIFVTISLGVISAVAIINTLTFPRLKTPAHKDGKRISLLVPARNEADKIDSTVRHLLAQDHPDFEVVILDDQSCDETSSKALQAGQGDPRLRVLYGIPLPEGWVGKNWACQQLSESAQGDMLIFTDADVTWATTDALSAIMEQMHRYKADVLTIWPTQMSGTFAERMVVPLIMFALMGYLPEMFVRLLPWSSFAAANGQCMVFRKAVYESIGGHAAVRQDVLEDVNLARISKRHGYRLAMALGGQFIGARMYKNWHEVRDGFAKNILAGHGGSPVFLILSALFHWTVFILPWIWLVLGFQNPALAFWSWWALALGSLGVFTRALTAAASSQRVRDAIFLPLSALMLTIISIQSLVWHYRKGGPQWKGRSIRAR